MARPTKQGIDYFPLDCKFDNNIEMYLIEKGSDGLAVLVTAWQMIYSNEGYYVLDDKDLRLLIKQKIDVDINEVSDCINVCLQRGIFCEKTNKKHKILTSKAIQKRYFEAAKKKKSVQIIEDYVINGIDSYDNWIDSCGNATNVNVKEEVKEKDINNSPEKNSEPTEDEIQIKLTLNDKSEYPILKTKCTEWEELFPAVDIHQSLRSMKAWLDANPKKRKTKTGVLRFVTAWLGREQDKGGNKQQQQQQSSTPPTRVEF